MNCHTAQYMLVNKVFFNDVIQSYYKSKVFHSLHKKLQKFTQFFQSNPTDKTTEIQAKGQKQKQHLFVKIITDSSATDLSTGDASQPDINKLRQLAQFVKCFPTTDWILADVQRLEMRKV